MHIFLVCIMYPNVHLLCTILIIVCIDTLYGSVCQCVCVYICVQKTTYVYVHA